MGLDLTQFGPALKQYYSNMRVENMGYKNYPTLALLTKTEDFYGDQWKLPIIHGNPQRGSATFSVAQANGSTSKLKAFLIDRFKDYSLASIDNETAEASENDKGAFLKALTTEIDGAIMTAWQMLAHDLFGNGSGSLGRSAASTVPASTSLVLADPESVVFFEVGQVLVASTADGGGAVKAGEITVAAVDRDNGIITTAANISTGIPTFAATDYLFRKGDYDLRFPGFAGWLPSVAPTSGDSFFGVDRSIDPTRLAGQRFDGSAFPIEEALIKLAARIHREGGAPDIVTLNQTKYSELEISLGSKVQYVMPGAYNRADISFMGIKLNTPKGALTVLADPYCPPDLGYMLQKNTWAIKSLKKVVRILDLDGNKMLRETTEDAVGIRVGGYKALGCNAPGFNGVVTF